MNPSPNDEAKQSPNDEAKQSPNNEAKQSPNNEAKQSPNNEAKQSPNDKANHAVDFPYASQLELLRKSLRASEHRLSTANMNVGQPFEVWDQVGRKSFGAHDLHDCILRRNRRKIQGY
jgi:hypothetical protein